MEEPSGERLLPDLQRGQLVHAEHMARYHLACQLAAGRRVLDAGSGEGYGTAMLSKAGAESAIGVDIDEETVERARERYGLEFHAADLVDLPFDDATFDLVVCFETLEHLADAERALSELRRVLADEGVLVVSTPNADEYLVDNEFHVRELTPAELDTLLAPHFSERTRLYQQNWLLSMVLDEKTFREEAAVEPVDATLFKAAGGELGRELYSVVACGPLERSLRPVGVAGAVHEAHRLAADVAEALRTRQAWQERGELAERQREEWERRARKAEDQREAWETRAAEAERQLAAAREQLREARSTLEKMAASLSWRATAPLRSARARLRPDR